MQITKTLYYAAFGVAIIGFIMEAWDIQHNIPFTFWLTGALALVTLLKLPYKLHGVLQQRDTWLPVMELLISLIAYTYLTYINIAKRRELEIKTGSVQLKLAK